MALFKLPVEPKGYRIVLNRKVLVDDRLEAFKNLEGGSPKKTIDGIEEYIHERRYIVKGNWEMVYALDELIGSVNDFVENIEKFEGVASELESKHYSIDKAQKIQKVYASICYSMADAMLKAREA